jgi:ribosomal protein S18 acetylase RimI-like enzyme
MGLAIETAVLRAPLGLLHGPSRIVRDAERGELAALAQVVAPQELCQRYEISGPFLRRMLQSAKDRGDGVLVVEDEVGRICGFAWFVTSGTFHSGGYLELIALEPGQEGCGHGAALLAEVEKRVAADRSFATPALFLLVSDWNARARRFYASHGYREVGRLPGFRRPDTDEIVCMKTLTDEG